MQLKNISLKENPLGILIISLLLGGSPYCIDSFLGHLYQTAGISTFLFSVASIGLVIFYSALLFILARFEMPLYSRSKTIGIFVIGIMVLVFSFFIIFSRLIEVDLSSFKPILHLSPGVPLIAISFYIIRIILIFFDASDK